MSSKSVQSQRWERYEQVLFQYSRKVTAHKDMKRLRNTVPQLSNRRPACRDTKDTLRGSNTGTAGKSQSLSRIKHEHRAALETSDQACWTLPSWEWLTGWRRQTWPASSSKQFSLVNLFNSSSQHDKKSQFNSINNFSWSYLSNSSLSLLFSLVLKVFLSKETQANVENPTLIKVTKNAAKKWKLLVLTTTDPFTVSASLDRLKAGWLTGTL